MLIKEAHRRMQEELSFLYSSRESSTVSDWVMEELTGWTRSQRIVHHDTFLSSDQLATWSTALQELKQGRPVQYVLGHSWFCGMRFKVDERVLIPRPETEELVECIVKESAGLAWENTYTPKALDIGTGSGCIAIALKKRLPNWEIHGMEKSESALQLARENAMLLEAPILWHEADILTEARNDHFTGFDLIVSNPPYIPPRERHELSQQVVQHEPHMALFTTEEDPLEFYRAIVTFSHHHLLRGGQLWFETHMDYAQEVATLLSEQEFEAVEVMQDMQKRDRIVRGKRVGTSL